MHYIEIEFDTCSWHYGGLYLPTLARAIAYAGMFKGATRFKFRGVWYNAKK